MLRQRKRRTKLTLKEKAEQRKKDRERKLNKRKVMEKSKLSERRNADRERRRISREVKRNIHFQAFENCSDRLTDVNQHNFDCFMASLMWYSCKVCKKKQVIPSIQKKAM